MKRLMMSMVLAAGLASTAGAVVNTRMDILVSTDGVNFSPTVNAVPGSTVEVLVRVTYTGVASPIGLASFVFQPTVSNWDAGDLALPLVNNGVGGNFSDPLGVVPDAPGQYGRIIPWGRTFLGDPNRLTFFTHTGGSAGAPPGSWLRIAQRQVTSWIGGPGNTTGGSGVPISQLSDVGRSTVDPAFLPGITGLDVLRFGIAISAAPNARPDLVVDAPAPGFGNYSVSTGERQVYWYNSLGEATGGVRGTALVNDATIHVLTGQGPIITTQPQSQTVCEGGGVIFSVAANGTPNPTFQWRRNTVPIVGATASDLVVSPVTAADAANYDCSVGSSSGGTLSNQASLVVNAAPTISTQPLPQTVCAGGALSLLVSAGASPAPIFQWQKDGVSIPGATLSTFSVSPVLTTDAGVYRCIIGNGCGTTMSTEAAVAVNVPPVVTANPTNQSACTGGSVTFTSAGSGSPTPSFQWRKAGVDIPGATSPTLVLSGVSAADVAVYTCRLSNSCGGSLTSGAAFALNSAVTITSNPSNQTLCQGGVAVLSVGWSGTPAPLIQWRRNGAAIPGATGSSYAIIGAGAADAGTYDCVLTNPCGSVTSTSATVAVNGPPAINSPPLSQTVCTGSPVTFTVTGSASPAPIYQWQKNGTNIAGATSPSLTIAAAAAGDAASYRCILSNTCGTTASSAATLTVTSGPTVTLQPSAQTVCNGGSATMTTAGTGTPAPTFQWRRSGVPIQGATSPTLTISPASPSDSGSYDCLLSNGCGSTPTIAAVLTVNTAPIVNVNPTSQAACAGGTATLSVAGSGTPAPAYQWRHGGAPVAGANGASLVIAPVGSPDGGDYDCVLTNACGSTTSSAANLTINTSPSITGNPSSQAVCQGLSATFTAAATGAPAPTFQWRKDGVPLGGETGTVLAINPVAPGSAGAYDCVVTNSCGTATTTSASLAVRTPPAVTTSPSSVTVCSGGPATFAAAGSGSPAPSFQWRRNGAPIAGATSPSLTLSSVTTGDGGSYDCVLSNTCGTATTTTALLVVNSSPSVTVQPVSQTGVLGSPASFTVTAGGSPAPAYQWRRNANPIGGATSPTFAIPVLSFQDAGSYDCVLTNNCGTVTTIAAQLQVGCSESWVDASPASPTFAARYLQAQAFDPAAQRTILFGGKSASVPAFGDTWSWDGQAWTQLSSTGPSPRSDHAMCAGPGTSRVLLFGGRDASGAKLNDLWSWDGASWTRLSPPSSPPARGGHQMVYDSQRGVAVLFGGYDANETVLLNDLWEWNGAIWSLQSAPGIPGRFAHSMAYDSRRHITVIYGGVGLVQGVGAALGDVWEWNGSSVFSRPEGPPSARNYAAAAFDVNLGRTLILGGTSATGTDTSEMWSWDGVLWRQEVMPGPQARHAHAMSYDSARLQVVMTGGQLSSFIAGDTWLLAGAPVIVRQPDPLVVLPGSTVHAQVVAGGPGLTFQWRRSGTPLVDGGRISGATTSTLTITNAQSSDQAPYDCIVSNSCGTVTTNSTLLNCRPVITQQPRARAPLTAGLQLTVSTPAGSSYGYRWRQNAQNLFNIPGLLSGVTTRTLTLLSVDPSLLGTYDCVLTDPCGTINSESTIVYCPVDFNGDGDVGTDSDIEAFFACLAGSCCAQCGSPDFNGDGDIGTDSDIEAFFHVLGQGC